MSITAGLAIRRLQLAIAQVQARDFAGAQRAAEEALAIMRNHAPPRGERGLEHISLPLARALQQLGKGQG